MRPAAAAATAAFLLLLIAFSVFVDPAAAEKGFPRRLKNDAAEDAALECFNCSRGDLLTFDIATRQIIRRTPGGAGVPDILNLVSQSGEGALALPGEESRSKDFGMLSQVVNPLIMDYPTHVRLVGSFITEGGQTLHFQGSGTLIDPRHVLTAGHCVYTDEFDGEDVNDWAESITVAPAYTNGPQPLFGTAQAVSLHSWSGWTGDNDYDWDMGVIFLDRPVGALTGWRAYGSNPNCSWYTGGYWTHYGYPGEDPHDGQTMWEQSGIFDGCESEGNEVYFDREMYGGQSGGGCLREDVLYTVRSNTTCDPDCDTYDVKINNTMYYDIGGWINAETPDTPDLIPLKVEVSGNATQGEFFSFDYLLHNYSSATATGSWTVDCYLSSDAIITALDYLLGSVSDGGPVGPKMTAEENVGLNLSCSITPGTYYLGVHIVYSDANPLNNWTGPQDVAVVTVDAHPAPPTPVTLSPINGAICRPRFDLPLSWSDAGPGYEYQMQIGTAPETGLIHSTSSPSATVTDLLASTYYYWRVRCKHDCTFWSDWSANGWFRTEPNPHVVTTAIHPPDGAHCIGSSTTLEWMPLDGAVTYDVQVSPVWCYEGDITTGITDNELTVSDLAPNTTYYWRVRCHNNCWQTTDWSSAPGFCFTFKTAPASIVPPVVIGPPDSTTCGSPETALHWNHAEDWDHYEVQVGTACGTGTVYTTVSNAFTPPDLESGVTYYWRVRAFHECGLNSDWTGCRSFSLDLEPPQNPTTLSSTSHTVAIWLTDNTIDVEWSWGSDNCDGVWPQYATLWDQSPTTEPTEPTTSGELTYETSPPLGDGDNHWFHLRTVDWAGNPAEETLHLGPFWIDTNPPSEVQITWLSLPVNLVGDYDELTVIWDSATDTASGVAGYSYSLDEVPVPALNDTVDTTMETVTLPLQWGTWAFQIAALDGVGYMGPVTEVGPFLCDLSLPAFLVPVAGQETTEGELVQVQWEPVARVIDGSLHLSTDGGQSFTQIASLTGEEVEGGSYSWTVPAENTTEAVLKLDVNGHSGYYCAGSPVFSIQPVADVERVTPEVVAIGLEPNYPNPFNPTTTIAYTLRSTGIVTLEVLDVRGRHVRTLISEVLEEPGRHEVVWDGTSDEGQRVSSGVYFYHLATPEFRQTRRMVLVK